MLRTLLAAALVCAASALAHAETGIASFYGARHHGRPMANGQRFDQWSDSCAHKTHRFGTRLRVALRSGRSILCTVRDRGPFIRGRIVDLSRGSARALGIEGRGTAPVTVEVVR